MSFEQKMRVYPSAHFRAPMSRRGQQGYPFAQKSKGKPAWADE
jgi:hypothetical protein